ncbi:MAG TPA: TonB-dependent receptor [Burkholderiaceae bacterium]|jgi:iron complex outermembrane receptor protein
MLNKTLVALAVAALVQSALAQEGPPTDAAPRPAAKLDRVEINSRPQSDSDLRRKSHVAKQIYGREELDKYGDTNVADVLKRLPGVTMQGSAPRMRGLGSGYTLILINGDPAPPGFDLSQLDPAQVERIEITKGPTADQSAQAVAGAINIILKDPPKVRQRDLRLSMSYNAARPTPAATFTYGERKGGLSYSIPVSAFEWRGENDSVTTRTQPGLDYKDSKVTQATRTDFWGHGFNSTPRVNWKITDDESLNLLAFLQKGHWHTRNTSTNSGIDGDPSIDPNSLSLGTFQMVRGNLQYLNRFSDSQRIELKASIQDVRATFNNDAAALDTVTPVIPERVSFGNNKDRSYTQSGKYAQLLGDEHSLAVGWELESRRRDELRTVLIDGVQQLPGVDGLPFAARIQRQALYVQDEWEISPQWSAYLGLRSERISTESATEGDTDRHNVSRVTTPLLHVNYKLDPKGRDLIRASLTRSYKAPDLSALLARPALSGLYPDPGVANTQLSPDRIGNPELKPELATGLDVAYEKYLSGGGLISVGAFYRSVSNLIRNITDLETVDYSPVQRWVSHPVNFSKAQTAGLEFEIKGRAGELLPSLFDPKLPLNLRGSLSYYHSRVEALPGPNNRLDGQQPWSGNLGFDYRLTSLPLNMGASLVFTPGYTTTQTSTQSLVQSRSRGLDMFAQWSFSRVTSVRLAVNNLMAVDTQADTLLGSGYSSNTTRQGRTFVNLGVDTKF